MHHEEFIHRLFYLQQLLYWKVLRDFYKAFNHKASTHTIDIV